jgi:hypothetical protein
MTSQQAGRCCGSLQTEHLFPVPNASHVYSSADLLGRVDGCGVPADRRVADVLVESREVPSRWIQVEIDQLPVGSRDKERHGSHLHLNGQSKLVAQERHAIGEGFDPRTQRQHRRMSSSGVVVQKNWAFRGIGSLQSSCHFSGMKWIAVLIGICRDEHDRWIGRPLTLARPAPQPNGLRRGLQSSAASWLSAGRVRPKSEYACAARLSLHALWR